MFADVPRVMLDMVGPIARRSDRDALLKAFGSRGGDGRVRRCSEEL
jgi:hypothetical protein